jgi:hypothetical protein
MGMPNRRASLNANGKLGSNFSFSMAIPMEYLGTMQALSPAEHRAFRRYLRKSKSATSLTDVDDQTFFEQSGEEEFRSTHP